ncbi:H/ACA ribonucleoprotein complex subunit 1 [Symbiodinium microadriaticum]|uniref:H/ACA ribonucleoprotein complex subunit 1 n=1 Tax=Symbiodinium microadriaticum TaxID=2951 RepID=A0A1Q9CXN6_SYMMI|nr:H/ACA ribonucleoprotein complex subunit 1 [Symbiodinium microadriaticum]
MFNAKTAELIAQEGEGLADESAPVFEKRLGKFGNERTQFSENSLGLRASAVSLRLWSTGIFLDVLSLPAVAQILKDVETQAVELLMELRILRDLSVAKTNQHATGPDFASELVSGHNHRVREDRSKRFGKNLVGLFNQLLGAKRARKSVKTAEALGLPSRPRKRPAKHGESWSPIPHSSSEEALSPGGRYRRYPIVSLGIRQDCHSLYCILRQSVTNICECLILIVAAVELERSTLPYFVMFLKAFKALCTSPHCDFTWSLFLDQLGLVPGGNDNDASVGETPPQSAFVVESGDRSNISPRPHSASDGREARKGLAVRDSIYPNLPTDLSTKCGVMVLLKELGLVQVDFQQGSARALAAEPLVLEVPVQFEFLAAVRLPQGATWLSTGRGHTGLERLALLAPGKSGLRPAPCAVEPISWAKAGLFKFRRFGKASEYVVQPNWGHRCVLAIGEVEILVVVAGGKGKGKKGKGKSFEPEGPPDEIEETLGCSLELSGLRSRSKLREVCKCTNERVPHFNARLFLENKDVFGPINAFYFSVKLGATWPPTGLDLCEGMQAGSFKTGKKFYIDTMKLLPLSRFLPQPPGGGKGGKGKGGKGKKGFESLELLLMRSAMLWTKAVGAEEVAVEDVVDEAGAAEPGAALSDNMETSLIAAGSEA